MVSFHPLRFVKLTIVALCQGVKRTAWFIRTFFRQFGQMYRGARNYVGGARLDTFIPSWFLRITVYAVPNALWGETPGKQIEGSIILMGWGFFTSALSGGATIVFVWFWSIFFWIGIIRYSEWGSSIWGRVSSRPSLSLPGRGSDGRYKTRRRN